MPDGVQQEAPSSSAEPGPPFVAGAVLGRRGAAVVLRARSPDNTPLLVKLLPNQEATAERVEALHREYELLGSLRGQGVPDVVGLVSAPDGLALMAVDRGVSPLRDLARPGAKSLERFFELALPPARALARLHDAGVLHGALDPCSILVHPDGGYAELLDLGAARSLDGPDLELPDGGTGARDPRYEAPELTGRVQWPVDARADLYSLGIVLYELLAGAPPFESDDPVQLTYSHIARRPRPLVRAELGVLADIVEALLRKRPEDRCPDAGALVGDLQACRDHLAAHGTLRGLGLGAGRSGSAARFQRPADLYGREPQLVALGEAFDRARTGALQIVALSGVSGAGKSSLLSEFGGRVHAAGGSFVFGRFGAPVQAVPYSALVEALDRHIGALAARDDRTRSELVDQLLEALGTDVVAACRLVPALAALLGGRPLDVELDPEARRTRTRRAVERLVSALASEEAPLVLALDDAQFADRSSLDLLRRWAGDARRRPILLLLSFRAESVDEPSPLVGEGFSADAEARIHLAPLTPAAVEGYVAHALGTTEARPLARWLFDKTRGNPYFLAELLERAAEDGHVWFDHGKRRWVWDLPALETATVAGDVVDRLIAQVERLDPVARQLLVYGACVGDPVDLRDLPPPPDGGGEGAWSEPMVTLVKAGLVAPGPSGDTYRFAHQRVFEAVCASVEPEARPSIQAQLARSLRRAYEAEPTPRRLYGLAEHAYQAGAALEEPERGEFAELALSAARHAAESAAFDVAANYYAAGLSLLDDEATADREALATRLHSGAAVCAAALGDPAATRFHAAAVHARADQAADRIDAWEAELRAHQLGGRWDRSLQVGIAALGELGAKLPARPGPLRLRWETWRTGRAAARWLQRRTEPKRPGPGPRARAISRIAVTLLLPAARSRPGLLGLLVLRESRREFESGGTANSPLFLAMYAAYRNGRGDLDGALRIVDEAERVAARTPGTPVASRTRVLSCVGGRWVARPLRRVAERLREAAEECGAWGDWEHATLGIAQGLLMRMASGESLGRVSRGLRAAESLAQQSPDPLLGQLLRLIGGVVDALRGEGDRQGRGPGTPGWLDLPGEPNRGILAMGHYLSGMHGYLLGVGDRGRADLRRANRLGRYLRGYWQDGQYVFWGALAELASSRPSMRVVRRCVKRLQQLADHNPGDYQHKLDLVRAEQARHAGDADAASQLFGCAINGARAHGLVHEQALARELAGGFEFRLGRREDAARHLAQARVLWGRWGARAKVATFDACWSEVLEAQAELSGGGSTSGQLSGAITLDAPPVEGRRGRSTALASILGAAHALASAADRDELEEILLRRLLEASGADRGVLLRPIDGELRPVAVAELEQIVEIRHLPLTMATGRSTLPVLVTEAERSLEAIAVDDVAADPGWTADEVVGSVGTRSAMALPLRYGDDLVGVAYLENHLATRSFSARRVDALKALAAQGAISYRNAALVEQLRHQQRGLEHVIDARTRQLQRATTRTRAILDSLADGVLTLDATGVVRNASPAALDLFRCRRPELIGASVARFLPTVAQELAEQAAGDAEPPANAAREVPGRTLDGQSVALEVSSAVVDLPGERLTTLIVRDIAERKEREEQLRAALLAAEQANETRARFLGGMSHELRTPLNSVLGFAQLLEGDRTLPETAQTRARHLRRSGSQLARLLNSMLSLANLDRGVTQVEEQTVAPAEFVRGVASACRAAAEAKGLRLVVEVPEELSPLVAFDEAKVEHILLHLLENAVKYTERGTIWLRVFDIVRPEGRLLGFEVEDTGVGIDTGEQQLIFERFTRTAAGGYMPGAGLGLAIAQEFALMLGGQLTLHSDQGSGSRFELVIPVTLAEPLGGGAIISDSGSYRGPRPGDSLVPPLDPSTTWSQANGPLEPLGEEEGRAGAPREKFPGLALLSPAARGALREAAETGLVDRIVELTADVPDRGLARRLRALAQEFAYEDILDLLGDEDGWEQP